MDLKNPPSCKKIYVKITNYIDKTIHGEQKWRDIGMPFPAFHTSWQAWGPMRHQEKLWKTKHFILHTEDRIDARSTNKQNQTGENCALCKALGVRPIPKDTHIHALWECKPAQEMWSALEGVINLIDAPMPADRRELILGMRSSTPKAKALDTLIGTTIHKLWRARCRYKHEKIPPKPGNIMAKIAIQILKNALQTWFSAYKNNNKMEDFKALFAIDGIFTVTPLNALQFYI